MHIGFVVISSILLIFCYIKTKRRYDLYMLIGVLSTLLIDVMINPPYFYIFAAEEIILLVLTIIDMHKVAKETEARKATAEKAKEEAENKETEEAEIKDDTADTTDGTDDATENTDEDSAS